MGLPLPGGFSDVEEVAGFELIDKGNYLFVVKEGEVKESGENAKFPGSQYINWQLQVAAEDNPFHGRIVFHITSLFGLEESEREEDPEEAKKSLGRIKHFLKNVGYTDDEINDEDFEIDIDDITGRYVMGEVYVKKDKGGEYPDKNQIRRLWPPDFEDDDGDELP